MAVSTAVELDIEVDAPFFGDPNSGDSVGKRNLGTKKVASWWMSNVCSTFKGSSEKEFLDFAEAWSGIHNSNFVEELENC